MKLTKKGFTLIEMLIVIVIIGILAAALIPQLTGIQGRARDTGRKADMNNVAGALQSYQLDMNQYPARSGDINNGSGGWIPLNDYKTVLAPSYIGVLPEESGAGNMPYQYAVIESNAGFVIGSISEGGKTNANWSATGGSGGSLGTINIKTVPGDITDLLSNPTITDMANEIANCANSEVSDPCRGDTSAGSARYLVAQ